MNNRQLITAIIAATAITSGITMAVTSAAQPGESENKKPSQEHRQEIKNALENNDFDAWVEALADHPKAEEFATQENFATIQEAHALKEAGDKEGAKALLEDAGIKHPGKKMHKGQKGEKFQEMRAFVENGDYDAWAESAANHPNADEFVNQETFATLQEAHELMEAGDKEGAKEVLEDAGIKRPKHRK